LVPGEGNQRLEGETLNVGGGGLALLLDETLPLGIPVYVEVCDEEPLRGHVVWTDQRVRRPLGTKVAHGVAFEQSVDAGRVGRWVHRAERRSHVRVPVQFDVECTHADTASHGTCLNLSQGGMFIATEHPVPPGTQVMLHFKLPSPAEPLSVPGRVAWMFRGETQPGTIAGMGVQFLDLTPLEAAVIGSLVDRLCTETATPVSS
ncbi:MAG: PilZ domain-containing protein, partial [Candidatus Methylomirabilales bacterium]